MKKDYFWIIFREFKEEETLMGGKYLFLKSFNLF